MVVEGCGMSETWINDNSNVIIDTGKNIGL